MIYLRRTSTKHLSGPPHLHRWQDSPVLSAEKTLCSSLRRCLRSTPPETCWNTQIIVIYPLNILLYSMWLMNIGRWRLLAASTGTSIKIWPHKYVKTRVIGNLDSNNISNYNNDLHYNRCRVMFTTLSGKT